MNKRAGSMRAGNYAGLGTRQAGSAHSGPMKISSATYGSGDQRKNAMRRLGSVLLDVDNSFFVYRLQRKVDSMPIAPHPPQTPSSSFKSLYRKRALLPRFFLTGASDTSPKTYHVRSGTFA